MHSPIAKRIENTYTFPQAVFRISTHLLTVSYHCIGSVFIDLPVYYEYYNIIKEQRTVLCIYRSSNSDPPDLSSCDLTTTVQRRTCSTQHSSFHYLLLYNKSIDIRV